MRRQKERKLMNLAPAAPCVNTRDRSTFMRPYRFNTLLCSNFSNKEEVIYDLSLTVQMLWNTERRFLTSAYMLPLSATGWILVSDLNSSVSDTTALVFWTKSIVS